MIVKIAEKKTLPPSLIGGKGYALNRLLRGGFNVPKGFILTTEAFDYFIDYNLLRHELDDLKRYGTGSKKLWCRNLQKRIRNCELPQFVINRINNYIVRVGLRNVHLILRSSIEVEDSERSSFAGQFKSLINVNISNIASSVKEIYASAFGYNIIEYCEKFGIPVSKLRVAIIFQEFIPGELSGVAFVDHLNNKKVIIESVLGLNEGLVSGRITPSRVIVDLDSKDIDYDMVSRQKIKFVIDNKDGTQIRKTKEDMRMVLDKSRILSMSQKFRDISALFKKPQDIEWTLKDGKLYILQSRNITYMPEFKLQRRLSVRGNVLYGMAASAGMAEGIVSVVDSPKTHIEKGNVLVTEYTNMDYLNLIKSASGVVTEEGGLLSHAAIISRELNKPCIVGVHRATKILKDGIFVTVNGGLGVILYGTKMHNIHIVNNDDELEWETLLYFEKIKKLRIMDIDVYYESLPDKIIVYSKPRISKKIIGDRLNGGEFKLQKRLVYGSNEKRFLYSMYLDNIKDSETKKMYEHAFYIAEIFSPTKLSTLFSKYLLISKKFVGRSKKIKATSHDDYLLKMLQLRRAYSLYILIDEYICKGYAVYTLFNNLSGVLERLDLSFSEFLYRVDSGYGINTQRLSVLEKDKLTKGMEYYKVLKDWHQNAFYRFSKIGSIGNMYDSERDKILYELNMHYKIIRDEDFWYLKSLHKYR